MEKFIVLSSQRSGSTWLMDILNNIDGVTASGELFIPRRGKNKTKQLLTTRSLPLREDLQSFPRFQTVYTLPQAIRPFSVFNYLNIFFFFPNINCFKLMYSQLLIYPEIWFYIIQKQLPIIHLVRKNNLDVIISKEVRKITNIARIEDGDIELTVLEIELNTKSLINLLNNLNRQTKIASWLLNSFNVKNIEIFYENLLDDPNEFKRIYEFLSIIETQVETISKFKKIITKDHSQIISNYAEIKKILSNTEYEWMIK